MIQVSKAVFDGLVAEGMRSVPPSMPPSRLPFWSGHIESRALRKTRVWQENPQGFDVLIEGRGIVPWQTVRVSHTLTAHQRMTLNALKIDPKNIAP